MEEELKKTDETDNALRVVTSWFEIDNAHKVPIMEEFREMHRLYKGDHWDLTGANGQILRNEKDKTSRPNAVENITFSLIEGLVSEFSEAITLIDYPVEQGDEESATTMTDIKSFISHKNKINREQSKYLRNFFLYGSGIWQTIWDENWRGGAGPNRWQGDIRWLSVHPWAIVPDYRCVEAFEDGRRVHKIGYWTIEDVKDQWETAADIIPDTLNYDFMVSADDDITIGGEDYSAITDGGQVFVVETWYRGKPLVYGKDEEHSENGLHVIWWAGDGNNKYLHHENYIYFEPGEDVQFPFHIEQCYPREGSIWGLGEGYMLKNPQIMRNKTVELIMEGHALHAVGQTWFMEGALSKKQELDIQRNGNMPGRWLKVLNLDKVKRIYGNNIPSSLLEESMRLERVMEKIVGRFDISQGQTPGNVTAFRALDLLASRAQVRLKSKENALHRSFEDCGNYINRLIDLYYTDVRKYRILGKEENPEREGANYGTYDPSAFKKAYLYDYDMSIPLNELDHITQGQEMLSPESQLLEGRDYEIYSPQFDVMAKVSSKLPTDRVFYMEMAKELYGAQLLDPEIFFYVIEHGKFPPFEELIEKVKEQKQAAEMQQQQMMQQQMQQQQMQQQQQQIDPEQARNALLQMVDKQRVA